MRYENGLGKKRWFQNDLPLPQFDPTEHAPHALHNARVALTHMNDHARAVDIGHLEVAHLGSAQARCIQHHHHGAMHQVPGRINEPGHLLLVQYGWLSQLTLMK
jgi:hypothetical protein